MTADASDKTDTSPAGELHPMDRRAAIRLLSTLGGAAFGALVLPPRWSAPRLEFGLLPAHADCTTLPTVPCGTGSIAVPFDGASPAKAVFGCTPYAVTNDVMFEVQFDLASRVVTVTPQNTSYIVVSASAGSVAAGVLTYTWSAANPVNTLNLIITYSGPCIYGQQYRLSVDAEITTPDGEAYTLNVRNLTSVVCSFN